jgi:PPOX class probable F420-dependent enzyme
MRPDGEVRAFLEANHGAIQATTRKDGSVHQVRVSVALVDGKLWGSSTLERIRTAHLRRDPRCSLLVLGKDPWHWLGLDCRVTILDGSDAPELNLKLYRTLAGEPDDVEEYLAAMVTEKRVIYEFEVLNAYGMYS